MEKYTKTDKQYFIYIIDGRSGFNREQYIKTMKLRYKTIEEFRKNSSITDEMFALAEIAEGWDEYEPLSIEDALKETDTRIRSLLFVELDVDQLILNRKLNPVLISKETVTKINHLWDEKSDNYIEQEIKDTYELYEVELKELGNIYKSRVVRIIDSTTGKTHWLWVFDVYDDPIGAVANSFRTTLSNPKRLYRQGDVLVLELPENPKFHDRLTPLSKEQYLSLMYSET